jgi:ABC-type transport system involved in cytochrome c biogenesis ATPase subunit
MSDLHLDSLEIKNFRCFEHLVIEKLGRVNLIVGKNSVGKTALLEGLWLLTNSFSIAVIYAIFYRRNELVQYNLPAATSKPLLDQAMLSLFFNSPQKPPLQIEISAKDLSFAVKFDESKNGFLIINRAKRDIEPVGYWDLPTKESLENQAIDQSKKNRSAFIPLGGLNWQALSTYWDDITLTDKEDDIINCLRILDSTISRLAFKGENVQNRVRYPVVRTGHIGEPVPLATLGEGSQRLLAIALAMSSTCNGFLLIDEFEAGLHHSIQANVWRAVFKLAQEWNIQVFATTHSWDCVEAFQQAAAEDQNEEAMLIRLQQKRDGSGIEAETYNERALEIITRQGLEVR